MNAPTRFSWRTRLAWWVMSRADRDSLQHVLWRQDVADGIANLYRADKANDVAGVDQALAHLDGMGITIVNEEGW